LSVIIAAYVAHRRSAALSVVSQALAFMDGSTANMAAATGDEPQQLTADLEASAGFSSLEKSRQVLVFQTIQEAISSVPPRLEASFPRVVAAYTTLSQVVEAAAAGQLSDDHLARLEADIEAAGGVIAPGLWSQGDSSVAAFRAATFGMLRRSFRPSVADAACAALNARLQVLKLNDLGMVFQVIAAFFSPLTPTTGNTVNLQAFEGLDADRQVLVFRTIQDAIQAVPPRSDATFPSVVNAFQSELQLLHRASEGQISDALLAELETAIEAAGGVLAPGTYAQGKQSVSSFRAETFKALQPLLPGDVLAAAVAALNVRLRDLRPAALTDLFKAVRAFFMPLLGQGWNSPTLQTFKTLDPERQTLVFRTIELAIGERPDLETTIFASAVKAIAAERTLIQAADQGQLSIDKLQALQSAIDECGGVIAPQLRASGEGSLGDFIESCFLRPGRELPMEVRQASIAALNSKLAATSIHHLEDLEVTTRAFMQPLIMALLHNPTIAPATRGEPLPPAADLHQPLTVTLVPPLEREQPDGPAQAGLQDAADASATTQAPPASLVPPLHQEQPACSSPVGASQGNPHAPVVSPLQKEQTPSPDQPAPPPVGSAAPADSGAALEAQQVPVSAATDAGDQASIAPGGVVDSASVEPRIGATTAVPVTAAYSSSYVMSAGGASDPSKKNLRLFRL
jgi:hypothetical protein